MHDNSNYYGDQDDKRWLRDCMLQHPIIVGPDRNRDKKQLANGRQGLGETPDEVAVGAHHRSDLQRSIGQRDGCKRYHTMPSLDFHLISGEQCGESKQAHKQAKDANSQNWATLLAVHGLPTFARVEQSASIHTKGSRCVATLRHPARVLQAGL
jgi:hypothetical protein